MALASLRPLRSRNFALLWTSALVSNAGSWLQAVALATVVTDATRNPLWSGLVAAAAFLPLGLLAPFGGTLADRLDRRRWLILTTVAETLAATALAFLTATGRAGPGLDTVLALLGGLAAAIGLPSYQAMLPDLVPRKDLLAAVSLSSAQFNMGRIVGPVLAGVVVHLAGPAAAFFLNAVSFGAVIVALTLVKLPPRRTPPPEHGTFRQMATGARAAWAEPGCRSAIQLIGIVALLASPFIALVPAMAIVALGYHGTKAGGFATAVLVTAQGVGAVVGVLLLPGLALRLGRRRILVGVLFLLPPVLVAYAVAPSLALCAGAMVLVGAVYIGVLNGLNTVVQLRAPEAVRGRVLSLYMFSLGTLYPVGAVLQGALGRHLGVRGVTAGGALALLAVLGGLALLAPRIFGALGEPRRPAGAGEPAAAT
jgi:MFS family permease